MLTQTTESQVRIHPKLKAGFSLAPFWIAIVLRVAYDYSFSTVVCKYWAYSGFQLSVNYPRLLLGWFAFILGVLVLPQDQNRPSSGIVQWLFFVGIMPLTSYIGLCDHAQFELTVTLFITLVLCFLLLCLSLKTLKPSRVSGSTRASHTFGYTLLLLLISVVIMTARFTGIHINALTEMMTRSIYEIRESQAVPSIISRLFVLSYRSILPVLFVRALDSSKYYRGFLYLLLGLVMYLEIPNKEILFSILLAAVSYFALKRFDYYKSVMVLLLVGIATSTLSALLFNRIELAAIIPNRLMTIPSQIVFEHLEYFSQHEHLFLSESSLGRLLGMHYPYGSYSSGQIISLEYHGSLSNSNVGFLGYAYDDLGYLGFFIAVFILLLVLLALDSLPVNSSLACASCIVSFNSLINVSLVNSLVTGGILFSLLALSVLGNNPGSNDTFLDDTTYISNKQ